MKQVLKQLIRPREVKRPAWQEILKWLIVGLATSLLLMFTQRAASAATYKAPDKETGNVVVAAGETINDDVYTFGGNVKILGNINGDLIVGGGRVEISGKVSQDVIAAGGEVNVLGEVGDDLRVGGGTVKIDGIVKDAVNVAGGTVIFTSKAQIGGDIAAAGGTIEVDGVANKNLSAGAGTITIFGRIGGNVNVSAASLRLADTAEVRGSLDATTQSKVLRAEGAKILGPFTEKRVKLQSATVMAEVMKVALSLLGLLAVGLILILIYKNRAKDFAIQSIASFWKSLGLGAAVMIIAPAAIIISMLTIIGLPLALISALMFGIAIYVAQIVAGLALGTLIFKIGNVKREVNIFLAFLAGMITLKLLMAVPYIGWLVSFVAILWGLGALIKTKWMFLVELKSNKKIEKKLTENRKQ
jgi:hypothetical protein